MKIEAKDLVAAGVPSWDAEHVATVDDPTTPLARSLFQAAAWQLVIDEDATHGNEPSWIEAWLRFSRSKGTAATGLGAAIERILAAGADPDDLTDVVRAMQLDVLVNLCGLLDMEGTRMLFESTPEAAGKVGWRLCALGENEKARRPIESLQESIQSYDPTGREGEPRRR